MHSPSRKWGCGVSQSLLYLCLVSIRRIKIQEEFKVPLCNSSGGNLLRQSCQTSTTKLLYMNSQRPKQVDCFSEKNSTTDLPPDFKCRFNRKCCVWVECKFIEFMAIGWCRTKWLRLYQTIRNPTSGDRGIQAWQGMASDRTHMPQHTPKITLGVLLSPTLDIKIACLVVIFKLQH